MKKLYIITSGRLHTRKIENDISKHPFISIMIHLLHEKVKEKSLTLGHSCLVLQTQYVVSFPFIYCSHVCRASSE